MSPVLQYDDTFSLSLLWPMFTVLGLVSVKRSHINDIVILLIMEICMVLCLYLSRNWTAQGAYSYKAMQNNNDSMRKMRLKKEERSMYVNCSVYYCIFYVYIYICMIKLICKYIYTFRLLAEQQFSMDGLERYAHLLWHGHKLLRRNWHG